jgi:hypothetical protein
LPEAAAEAVEAVAAEAVAAAEAAVVAEAASLGAAEVVAAAAACPGEPAGFASSRHFGITVTEEILVSGGSIGCVLFATLPICPMGSLAHDDAKVKH